MGAQALLSLSFCTVEVHTGACRYCGCEKESSAQASTHKTLHKHFCTEQSGNAHPHLDQPKQPFRAALDCLYHSTLSPVST